MKGRDRSEYRTVLLYTICSRLRPALDQGWEPLMHAHSFAAWKW